MPLTHRPVALITGASRGLGRATALELARRGYTVVTTTRGGVTDVASDEVGGAPRALAADVTAEPDRLAIAAEIESTYGRLDLLINNAATWLEPESTPGSGQHRTSDLPSSVLRATFEANLFAPVRLTQILLPALRRAPTGRILNISSTLASLTLHSTPASSIYQKKVFAYGASKTALNAFTVSLAHELIGTNVTVNSLDPGQIRVEPTAGTMTPTECAVALADLVLWRLEPDVNGRFLTFDRDRDTPW